MIFIAFIISLINTMLTVGMLTVSEHAGVVFGVSINTLSILAFVGLFFYHSRPVTFQKTEKILGRNHYRRSNGLSDKF